MEFRWDQTANRLQYGRLVPWAEQPFCHLLHRLFGDAAYALSMSSTKSSTGHLLGAAGAVEAIFSILAVQNDIVPPTINLDDPSDGCGDMDLVPFEAKKRTVRRALSNSFGFGGTNASLIFGKVE